ncbi:MAG: hypothetical protein RKP73_13090 [Candidatus Contendobacter sp.]|nr:hypothetical protein [Candidatus Contendobacter sp.]
MATHRVHDTGFPPAFDFQLTMDVLAAIERLTARRRPITPTTLARQLRTRATTPTLPQIEATLRQVEHWRQHVLTRDLLQHFQELTVLRQRVEAEQQRLAEDWVYLNRMLQDARALLENATPMEGRALTGAAMKQPLQ